MRHPTDRITHTTAFVTSVVEHWLEREIAQWVLCNQNILFTVSELYGINYFGWKHFKQLLKVENGFLLLKITGWFYTLINMGKRSDNPSHHEWMLTPLYIEQYTFYFSLVV